MRKTQKIYIFLVFLFLYAPLFLIILFSFNSTKSTAVFSGFSLKWYETLLHDESTLRALRHTVVIAVLSSLVSTVLGTVAAVGISKLKKAYVRKAVMTVTNIPMMNPDIVTGVSMMLMFVFVGRYLNLEENLGFWSILIAHITFNLPYVILSVMPKIKQMDKHLIEAAEDLGCTPFQSFMHVELPAIMPGIITGFITAITLSIDDFVISYFTAGTSYQTLPIKIFTMTKARVTPDIYALSTIIFGVVLVLLLLVNLPSKEERKINKLNKAKRKERV